MTESEGMGVEHSLHDRMKGGKKMSKISQSACTHLKYPYTENRVTKPGEQINFSREKQGLHRTTQLFYTTQSSLQPLPSTHSCWQTFPVHTLYIPLGNLKAKTVKCCTGDERIYVHYTRREPGYGPP